MKNLPHWSLWYKQQENVSQLCPVFLVNFIGESEWMLHSLEQNSTGSPCTNWQCKFFTADLFL